MGKAWVASGVDDRRPASTSPLWMTHTLQVLGMEARGWWGPWLGVGACGQWGRSHWAALQPAPQSPVTPLP